MNVDEDFYVVVFGRTTNITPFPTHLAYTHKEDKLHSFAFVL